MVRRTSGVARDRPDTPPRAKPTVGRPRGRFVLAAAVGALLVIAFKGFTPVNAAFSRTTSNAGNSLKAANDMVAPSGTVDAGTTTGRINQSGSYNVYANLTDTGGPASGISSVTANASTITAGQTAAAMTGGAYTFGGVSYNYRTAALTAAASLTSCSYSYGVKANDAAGNSSTTTGRVMVDRDLASEYHLRLDGPSGGASLSRSIAAAGDVNNDGRNDVIIGREQDDYSGRTDSGIAYVIFGTATQTTIDLNALGAAQGFKIAGAAALDYTGTAVASVGDVNGDGYGDVAVGANGSDTGGTSSGAVYIIWGKTSGTLIDLNSLGTAGYKIVGGAASDYLGSSLANLGNLLGGDSLNDLLIGAPTATGAGRAFVLQMENRSTQMNLSSFNAGSGVGFLISNPSGDAGLGTNVANIGDINADGKTDMMVGAPWFDPASRTDAGAVFVVFGKTTTTVTVTALGTAGFQINGAIASAGLGRGLAGLGDINGDAIPDLLVGASSDTASGRTTAGVTDVVFGKASTSTVDMAALGTGGYRIFGAASGDKSGWSVAALGDINSDGVPDMLIGAPFADPFSRASAGAAYVVFGQSASTADIDLAALGTRGYVLQGSAASDEWGYAVVNVGDINGDGRTDVGVAGINADPNGRTDTGEHNVFALPAC